MDSFIFFYLARMGGHNKDISITIKKNLWETSMHKEIPEVYGKK